MKTIFFLPNHQLVDFGLLVAAEIGLAFHFVKIWLTNLKLFTGLVTWVNFLKGESFVSDTSNSCFTFCLFIVIYFMRVLFLQLSNQKYKFFSIKAVHTFPNWLTKTCSTDIAKDLCQVISIGDVNSFEHAHIYKEPDFRRTDRLTRMVCCHLAFLSIHWIPPRDLRPLAMAATQNSQL